MRVFKTHLLISFELSMGIAREEIEYVYTLLVHSTYEKVACYLYYNLSL